MKQNKLNKDKNYKYYKGQSTNENRGYATHGKFKNTVLSGGKQGQGTTAKVGGSHKGFKQAKETLADKDPVNAKLRRVSKAFFGKRTEMSTQAAMRAQLNG